MGIVDSCVLNKKVLVEVAANWIRVQPIIEILAVHTRHFIGCVVCQDKNWTQVADSNRLLFKKGKTKSKVTVHKRWLEVYSPNEVNCPKNEKQKVQHTKRWRGRKESNKRRTSK